jgi:hypothetical protein
MNAETPTPKPQAGIWTLTAPDGRTWTAETPLRACGNELKDRVPADVALARIFRAAAEPVDIGAAAMLQALEALEYHQAQTRPIEKTARAIESLRSALAAPQQTGAA